MRVVIFFRNVLNNSPYDELPNEGLATARGSAYESMLSGIHRAPEYLRLDGVKAAHVSTKDVFEYGIVNNG